MSSSIKIGEIHLDELDDEQLERFAMDLTKDQKAGKYKGRNSVYLHKIRKIRAEWDRRDA